MYFYFHQQRLFTGGKLMTGKVEEGALWLLAIATALTYKPPLSKLPVCVRALRIGLVLVLFQGVLRTNPIVK